MRLFLGVPVPGQEKLRSLRPHLEQAGLRPVPDGSWHVTLRFYGAVDPKPVEEALDPVLREQEPMGATVHGLGAFPSPEKARVVWAGVDASGLPALEALAVAATRTLGEPVQDRPFVPHVTVARAPRDHTAHVAALVQEHAKTTFARGMLDEVVLFRSTTGPDGPSYDRVRTWHLRPLPEDTRAAGQDLAAPSPSEGARRDQG